VIKKSINLNNQEINNQKQVVFLFKLPFSSHLVLANLVFYFFLNSRQFSKFKLIL